MGLIWDCGLGLGFGPKRKRNYDCQRVNITTLAVKDRKQIRGPCEAVDLTEIAKERLLP